MVLRLVCLCALLLAGANGQDLAGIAKQSNAASGWRSAKRIFAVTGCVAQGMDLYSTHRALRTPGNYELNPLLRSQSGGVRWSVALPLKSAACALPFVFRSEKLDKLWTFYGLAETGTYSGLAFRNFRK